MIFSYDRNYTHTTEDAFTSEDPEKPITAGLYTVDKSDEPFVYKYGYHEVSTTPLSLSLSDTKF